MSKKRKKRNENKWKSDPKQLYLNFENATEKIAEQMMLLLLRKIKKRHFDCVMRRWEEGNIEKFHFNFTEKV